MTKAFCNKCEAEIPMERECMLYIDLKLPHPKRKSVLMTRTIKRAGYCDDCTIIVQQKLKEIGLL